MATYPTTSSGLEMSLDDYIASANIKRPLLAQKYQTGCSTLPDRFRRFEQDKEESDDDMGDRIWKGPSSSSNFLDLVCDDEVKYETVSTSEIEVGSGVEETPTDLRQRINGPCSSSGMLPDIKSQQWRLLYPNNDPERRSGIPPLVPQELLLTLNSGVNQAQRRRRGGRKCGNRPYFPNNNNKQGNWGKNKDNNMNNSCRSNGSGLNEKFARSEPERELRLNLLNQSLNTLLRQMNDNYARNNAEQSRGNMQINQNKSAINLEPNPPLARFEVNKPTTCANSMVDGLQYDIPFPLIHKPTYNMDVQKEIHAIQEKPIIYKPSEKPVIISSDGAGIDCTIIPRSSGMSMNYRFT